MDPHAREALAPGGRLRAGLYAGSPTSMVADPASGEARGVGHDLARALAARLGVAFEPVVFQKAADVLEAAKQGRVDVVFTNATPERARDLDFTPAVLDVELGYLVAAGSRIADAGGVDRPGVRVGVSQGSTSHGVLSRGLRQATVAPVSTLKAAVEGLRLGKLAVFATNKAILFEMGGELAGSRVLEGNWGLEHLALGIPKGRDAALPILMQFALSAAREGLVDRAVQRAGLRGTARPGAGCRD